MAISLTAEAVILAINAAIKLGKNLQRAYAKSAKSKTIFLPLPQFDIRPNADRAHRFFTLADELKGGNQFVTQIERLNFLFQKFENGLLLAEQEEYVDYYQTLSFQLKKDEERSIDQDGVNTDDLVALLRVKQWEDGSQPRNSPLEMVAGTIVEIGIDYFNQVPGALNVNSTFGRTMRHFLTGLDRVRFSETEDLRDLSRQVVPKLFIAAAEAVKDLKGELTNDRKLQAFIEATTQGIAKDVFARSKHKHDDIPVQWGQLLLRSMVKNAGHYVFHSPADLFNTNEGASLLIQKTGGVLMDIILSDPDGLNLQAGFNVNALDRLVKATFEVVALHPELIDKRDGFREIVIGVSQAMAEAGIKNRPDLLPELVRLILEHTASHLSTLMGKPGQGTRYLLVEAVREVLLVISKHDTPGPWKPRLSKRHILAIANHILDEVVMNPDWILVELDDKKLLQKVLEATFDALSTIPAEERLNLDVLELLIQLNIRTVATSQLVLERVPWGSTTEKVVMLEQALNLIFAFVFDQEKVHPAERVDLLIDLLEYVLAVIIRQYPDERGLVLIDLILFKDPNVKYSGGFDRELAEELIDSALRVLENHPDLLTTKISLQKIVSGIARSLKASSFQQPGALPELLRLVLDYTGRNLFLLLEAEEDEPQYLLLIALEELLQALSTKANADTWQLRLSWNQVLLLVEEVFDHLLLHPEWVLGEADQPSLLSEVLTEVFDALRLIPKHQRIDPATLEQLIQLSLYTAAASPKVLGKIKWGSDAEEKTILKRALSLVFHFVFEKSTAKGAERIGLLMELVEYVLDVILAYHPEAKGLILIDLILFEDPNIDYRDGFNAELADQLIEAGLDVLQAHPALISEQLAFQQIIVGVSGALSVSDFRSAGLLPELVRLTLSYTAQNLQLLVISDQQEARYLLVEGVRLLLVQLSTKKAAGTWRPHLSGPQLVEVVEEVLDILVQYPSWLIAEAGKDSLFETVLESTFAVLAQVPKEQRLRADTLSWLIQTVLRTAILHPTILDRIKWENEAAKVSVLQQALDLVFAYVFSKDHPGQDRSAMLEDLLSYVLEVLIAEHPDKTVLLLLYLIFFEDEDLVFRKSWNQDEIDDLVAAALLVIEAHPELVTKDLVFQKIVKDTAQAVRASKLSTPDLFPELLRLVLVSTADNVELIVGMKANSPRYILAVALEQSLRVLAAKPKRGKWKPSLSAEQIVEITALVLDAVAENPQWITRDKLMQELLRVIFAALEVIPKDRRIGYETIRHLILLSLEAVSFRKQLIIEIVEADGSRKKLVLSYALEGLFIKLYDEDNQSAGTWTLTQTEVIHALIEWYLLQLSEGPANQAEVDKALAAIDEAIVKLNSNLAFSIEDLKMLLTEQATA